MTDETLVEEVVRAGTFSTAGDTAGRVLQTEDSSSEPRGQILRGVADFGGNRDFFGN